MATRKIPAEIFAGTPRHNAWIPAETREGEAYWAEMQAIRAWTKANHYRDPRSRRRGARGKGRGPVLERAQFHFQEVGRLVLSRQGRDAGVVRLAPDSSGLTLIPLNMAEPILIARGRNADNGLGFAPHGAGRNLSRTAYIRRHAGKTEEPDRWRSRQKASTCASFAASPMSPSCRARKERRGRSRQIAQYGLAEIVDDRAARLHHGRRMAATLPGGGGRRPRRPSEGWRERSPWHLLILVRR